VAQQGLPVARGTRGDEGSWCLAVVDYQITEEQVEHSYEVLPDISMLPKRLPQLYRKLSPHKLAVPEL
jgi:hypothetical protein